MRHDQHFRGRDERPDLFIGMSADRLREMLSEATPGSWEYAPVVDGPWAARGNVVVGTHPNPPAAWITRAWVASTGMVSNPQTQANARLIALAPDAIALLADFAEAAESSWPDFARVRLDDLLARLDALCGDER